MTWWQRLLRKRKAEYLLNAELRDHFERQVHENLRAGLTAEEAERQARLTFGGLEQIKEECRDARGTRWLEIAAQDFRLAFRTLRKASGFSLAAIATLGLGIGAVTAVFSVVDSIVLRPLAYRNPGQLVVIREVVEAFAKDYPVLPVNEKHFEAWTERSRAFSGFALLDSKNKTLLPKNGRPVLLGGVETSQNFFSVLGVKPAIGRPFRTRDFVEGNNHVAILTNGLWKQQFHGDPEVVGQTAKINDHLVTVIGVLPDDFHFPQLSVGTSNDPGGGRPIELFTPLLIDRSNEPPMGSFNYLAIGRLRPGVSVRRGEQELTGIVQAFAREHSVPAHLRTDLQTIQQNTIGPTGHVLWLLLAAVGGVLLIGCVNLASLQLARAVGKRRENAIRSALGGSRQRIALTQLAESCLLGTAGGALGILLAYAGVRLFVRAAPVDLPRLAEVQVNPYVLLVSVLVTIGTVFIFGFIPAWDAARIEPQGVLQGAAGRAVAGSRSAGRMRSSLVCLEVCGTTVLLIVSAAALRSLFNAFHTNRAFDANRVIAVEADLFKEPYSRDAARVRFDNEVLDRLRTLPGVEAAALTQVMPLTGNTHITDVGRADRPFAPERQPLASFRAISSDYFSALRIPILAGRNLRAAESDRQNAVISQSVARTLWPGEDPLGHKLLANNGDAGNTFTVVGVAADARTQDLKSPGRLMFYYPFRHDPPYATFFLVRSAQSPQALLASVRKAIWSVDSEVAVPTLKTLNQQVDDSLATERFATLLLASFGAAAVALALLGIYGVLAFFVSLCAREIGVRIALGATRQKIYRLTFALGMKPVLAGIAAGSLLGWAATRSAASLLFEVRPGDPLSIALAITILLAAACAATVFPSRRAASIDPAATLRSE